MKDFMLFGVPIIVGVVFLFCFNPRKLSQPALTRWNEYSQRFGIMLALLAAGGAAFVTYSTRKEINRRSKPLFEISRDPAKKPHATEVTIQTELIFTLQYRVAIAPASFDIAVIGGEGLLQNDIEAGGINAVGKVAEDGKSANVDFDRIPFGKGSLPVHIPLSGPATLTISGDSIAGKYEVVVTKENVTVTSIEPN